MKQESYRTSGSDLHGHETCTTVYENAPTLSMLDEQYIKECVPDYETFPFAPVKFAQKVTFVYKVCRSFAYLAITRH